MDEMYVLTKMKMFKIREDSENEYLIPICPINLCKFTELEQKCKELKERLPEDVVDVYVPSLNEIEHLPEEIRGCGDSWWTSTISPLSSSNACYVYVYGYIGSNYVGNSYGFRPIIVRRK